MKPTLLVLISAVIVWGQSAASITLLGPTSPRLQVGEEVKMRAVVRDGNGAMVRNAQSVTAGAALGIGFGDGNVRVQAIEDGKPLPQASIRPMRKRAQALDTTSGDGVIVVSKTANATRVSKPRIPPKSGNGGGAGGQGTLF